MSSCRFGDYIDFLRKHMGDLNRYRECTGTLEPELLDTQKDLSDPDPFVVIRASVQATKAFADKNLYH